MREKAHVFVTMFISFLAVLLNCFINLYLTPIITNNVGVEAFGFVTLAKQFTNYAAIAMMALNSYAARYMTISYMQKDIEDYKKYYNTVFFADFFIGSIILVVGILVIIKIELLINIPLSIIGDVKFLFLLTFVTFYFTTVTTVFSASGYVKNRLDVINTIKGGSYLVEIIALIICYKVFTPHVWYVGLATCLAAMIMFGGALISTKKMIPESKIEYKYFNYMSLKKLVLEGIWNTANSLGNMLNTGLDLLVSNLLLSALSMGQISVSKTINNLVYMLYTTVAQPFHPIFLKKYADGDTKGLIAELKYSMKICGMLSNVVFGGFCVLGLSFYRLWIPTQDIRKIYALTVIAMIPCLSEGCVFPLYYIYTLTVKNKVPCIVTIIGGLLNVFGMAVLIKYTNLGAYSIVITTAVIMNIINIVINPIYMSHCLRISKKTFYPTLFLNILCCTAAICIMLLVSYLFTSNPGWIMFIIECLICGSLGILIQLVIMFRPKEIQSLVEKIRMKLYKRTT